MFTLIGECRSAGRYLRRRPVFGVAVAATLAMGIGVTATAVGIARAVLWRGLPFDDPGRLVFVWEETERDGQRQPARVTGARFEDWRRVDGGFASLSLFGAAGFTVDGPHGASSVRGVRVSANYFETLGIRAALGRTFMPEEEQPGHHRVVILADAFWRERFGARPEAVGETLRLGGESYRIVGVMPPGTYPAWPVNPATVTLEQDSRQFWVPIPQTPALGQSARAHVFGVLGRLKHGVTAPQAADRLRHATDPTAADPHLAHVEPLREQFVSDARTPLLALAAAAIVLLLIACANLASLYASAFESRRAELSVRAALGAGVPRLARQLLFEALALGIVGATAGLAIASVTLAAVPSWLPPTIPFLTLPALDAVVVIFAVALGLVASIAFTAWPITRLIATGTMARGVAPRTRGLVHRALVVSQVALTMALVPAAALLEQSLRSVRTQDPGFDIDRVLVANVALPSTSPAPAARITQAEQAILSAVAARSGVVAVAAAYDHPLEANWSESPTLVGDAAAPDESRQSELRIVTPGYFEALGVRLVDGRTLTDRDGFGAPGVAVVNEAFARESGGRVLGRRLRSGTPRFMYGEAAANEFEIVGVVANERVRGLERPAQPAFYLSTRQFPQTSLTLLVRTSGDPLALAADVRSAIRAADARVTFDGATSLTRILSRQLVSRRVTTNVIGMFALAALALASLGMYGLLTMLVGTRSHEIAVRIAVGASPASVARHVLGDSLRTATFGIVCGAILSLAATRFIRHLLVDISPTDPLTIAAATTVMISVATAAAFIPATRAARTDPTQTLRAKP